MNTLAATGTEFWNTGLGSILATFMQVIGVLVVIIAIFRVISHMSAGQAAKAFKAFAGSVILAVFLIQPVLINTVLDASAGLVKAALTTASDIAGGGSSSTPTTPTTPAGSTTN